MKNAKTLTIFIATLFILSIGASTLTRSASADTVPAPTIKTTFAYVQALPNNVGVGDSITIYMWIDKTFPNADMQNDYRFHNYQITITKPDNTTETKTFATVSDTTSNQAYVYTPTQTGTYHVTFNFPQTNVNATSHVTVGAYGPDTTQNDVYLASNATCTFTVQETSIGTLPDSYPLPSEYWTRPIYGENSYWYTISSNWLGNGAPGYLGFESSYNYGGNGQLFPSDAVGSLTSHVMWTKELQSGGVVGGTTSTTIPGNTYFEGSAYLQRYINPIIVSGHLIYTEPVSYLNPSGGDAVCVDLRTGAEIWRNPSLTSISFALIFDPEDPNQHGVHNALLISTAESSFDYATYTSRANWTIYDADTGKYLYKAYNIPSGRSAQGPNGEYIQYVTANTAQGYTVAQWNSSNLWTWSDTPAFNSPANAAASTMYDWTKAITYNGANWTSPFTVVEAYYNDVMLCYNGTLPSTGASFFFGATASQQPYTYFAVSLNKTTGTYGQVQWIKTITPTLNATIIEAGVDPVNRVFVENIRELNAFNGFSLNTGEKLWTTTDHPQVAMDYYGSPASASLSNMFAYGNMYSSGYGGIVYCYDTTDGSLTWTYGNGGAGNSTDGGLSVPGNYPTFVNGYGNGVIYTVSTEHTIETPLYKGALARAINATTGAEIWTISDYTGEFMYQSYAIADGYNTWFNGLDNQIYVVGRGPSQLTVSAPDVGLVSGQSVMIKGSVTDISAGTTTSEQAARFPQGVPVSSDASMKDWMGYVYQQKPLPTNFTGVEVVINVVDANGNYRSIGTATTDATGTYTLAWKPDISGEYKVVATFAGTNGYWPALAETGFVVDEPVATATPAPTPAPTMADLYFLPGVIGIILTVIVVGVVLLLALRKHP